MTLVLCFAVANELCKEGAFQAIKLQMALDFLDGEGEL